MKKLRRLAHLLPCVCVGFVGFWLLGDVQVSEARRRHRRERKADECKPPPTIAQQDQDKAMRFYDSAVIYWESKDWDHARSDFQNAYNITKLPDFLINLALVSERQRKFNDSIGFFESYIDNCPNAADLDKVKQKIDELKIAIAIQAGEKPAGEVKGSLPPIPAIALMAGGGAFLLTGIGLGSGALAQSKQVSAPENRGQAWNSELQGVESSGQKLATSSYVLSAIGGAALAAGVVWTGVYYARGNTGLSLALVPQNNGLGALVLGRF